MKKNLRKPNFICCLLETSNVQNASEIYQLAVVWLTNTYCIIFIEWKLKCSVFWGYLSKQARPLVKIIMTRLFKFLSKHWMAVRWLGCRCSEQNKNILSSARQWLFDIDRKNRLSKTYLRLPYNLLSWRVWTKFI